MANEVDDIVQNIVLTGNEEVNAAFESMQKAGETAFEAIEKAIESSLFSFKGLATVVAGASAAIAIVGVGMFEFVKSTEASVSSLSDLADQAGTTTEEMSGLKAAFAAGGIEGGSLEQAFRRLSVTIQQSWTEIKNATRQSADQLKGDMLAVQSASIALSDALQKQANTQRDQQTQRAQNQQSVAAAQLRVDELFSKSKAAQGFDTSELDARLALQKQVNEQVAAEQALILARRKAADDAANAEKEAAKAAIAAQQAQLTLNQAVRKEQDDQKNDINNVTNAVKSLADGNKGALDTINASAENITKGIIKAAKDAEQPLGELKGSITDLAQPGPKVEETFLQIGKVLQQIDDPALKTAVSYRLLGRTISQEFLNVLSDPSKIKDFIARINELGLAVNEADKEVSEKFRSSLFTLENDIQLVGIKLATAFGPSFTAILNAIDDALLKNKDSLIALATSVGNTVQPIIESFIRVLSGVPDAAKDQWLLDYVDKIKTFGTGVLALGDILKTLVTTIAGVASGIAEVLNNLFGTNLNGFDVLLTLWVAKVAANFALTAQAAATAATGIQASLLTVSAELGIAFAAVFALVKAWQAYQDATESASHTSHLDAMLEGLHDRLAAIGELIISIGKALGELVTNPFKAFEDLSASLKKFVDDWKAASAKQIETEKTLDIVDKQVADGKKARQAELAKAEQEALKSSTDSHTEAAEKNTKTSTDATNKLLADNKRVTDDTKKASQEQGAARADALKLQQTTSAQQPFIPGSTTVAQPQTSSIPNIIDVQKQLAEMNSALAATGVFKTASGITVSQPKSIEDKHILTEFEDPIKTFTESVATFKESVSTKSIRDAQDIPDISSPIPSGPGTVPVPPTGLPLGPPTTFGPLGGLGALLQDAFPGLKNLAAPPPQQEDVNNKLLDFLSKAFTDPGALKSQTRPEDVTPTAPVPLEAQVTTETANIFKSAVDSFVQFISSLSTKLNPTVDQPANLGIRGDVTDETATVTASLEQVGTAADTATDPLNTLATAASNAAQALASIQNNSAATVTAAGGGYVRGPGGPTGDRIHAMVSDEEYIHRAAATRFWGVDFMDAINNLQMPRFPKFSAGGLVGLLSPQMPRFAGGGAVSASNVGLPHLGSVDLTTDHGPVRVITDRGGLADLKRAAVRKNIGSSPKSSWAK